MNWKECIEKGLLRRMELSEKDVEASMEQAGKWLSETEMNIGAGAYRSAISSAYMAMFHSARALLYREGYREKSHFCVARFLDGMVEKGLLEQRWVDMLDRARNVRHADQYNTDFIATEEDAESMFEMARAFVERMKALLGM